jgi:hypothetical protein
VVAFIGLIFTICALLLGHLDKPEPPTTHEHEIVQELKEISEHQEQEIEQLKQMNEHLAEKEAKEDAKPPKEHY